ncbi:MAG: DUF1444 family protein [Planctomycetota bacterium]
MSMPIEQEAFAEHIATLIRQARPGYEIDLAGPRELLVNGRRLDLENLLRMVVHEPTRGADIVEQFIGQLFGTNGLESADMPFTAARSRIMPRIQPESIFEHLSRELVAHVPYVNGTVIVFVIDLPNMTVSITSEQMLRWGVSTDDLEVIARDNLDEYAPELDIQVIESREGGRAVILAEQDGYDASRLLMRDLHKILAPRLGGDFYAAVPARDMLIAMSTGPEGFVERLSDRVEEDHARLPYPLSPELFLVTLDGVAGTRGNLAA